MIGDIVQSLRNGWFYRDNGNGIADDLSGPAARVDMATIANPVVLVREGVATGHGDPLASRVAVIMARRYTEV
jgi:hypothetical protein